MFGPIATYHSYIPLMRSSYITYIVFICNSYTNKAWMNITDRSLMQGLWMLQSRYYYIPKYSTIYIHIYGVAQCKLRTLILRNQTASFVLCFFADLRPSPRFVAGSGHVGPKQGCLLYTSDAADEED